MLVNKNLLREIVLLNSIAKMIETDRIEIVPGLISKLEQLQSELPFWITELKEVIDNHKKDI
jgi:hypothetical protein